MQNIGKRGNSVYIGSQCCPWTFNAGEERVGIFGHPFPPEGWETFWNGSVSENAAYSGYVPRSDGSL